MATVVTSVPGTLLPAYLNEALVRTALEQGLEYPGRVVVKIHQHVIRSATTAGDNYLSDVFRVWVRFSRNGTGQDKSEDVSLIVKCMPAHGPRGSIIEQLNVFEKEVDMFREVVPRLAKLVAEGEELFAAKLYYATEDPIRLIVFQDLNALGYSMADRGAGGLDYDHCALVMRKIAKFHAASMALMAGESPSELGKLERQFEYSFINPQISQESNTVLEMCAQGLSALIKCAEKWSNFNQNILHKLKSLQPIYKKRVVSSLNQSFTDGFKVINHGDLWINNMLFKYGSEGEPKDVVFVDYQLSCYTSPGIDLNYSLINCPSFDVREKHWDQLVGVYHKTLEEALLASGYKPVPTLADVQREIKRMSFHSFFAAVTILPIVTMERTTEVESSLETMMDAQKAEQLRTHQYNGRCYRRSITVLLERFNREGLLD